MSCWGHMEPRVNSVAIVRMFVRIKGGGLAAGMDRREGGRGRRSMP